MYIICICHQLYVDQRLISIYAGIGGLFGAVLQSIPQLATQAIGGILSNRPTITLPGKAPDYDSGSGGNSGGSGSDSSNSQGTGSCKCIDAGSCFLPSKAGVN